MVVIWMPPERENTSVQSKEGKWVCGVRDHTIHMEQVDMNTRLEEDLPRGMCGQRSWFEGMGQVAGVYTACNKSVLPL